MNEQEFDPKQYEIHIRVVENRYIVSCGCKTFVFNGFTSFMKEFENYINGKTTLLTKPYFTKPSMNTLRPVDSNVCCATVPCPPEPNYK